MNIPQEVIDEADQLCAKYYLDHLTPTRDYKDGFLACWAWVAAECAPRAELERLQTLVDHWYTVAKETK